MKRFLTIAMGIVLVGCATLPKADLQGYTFIESEPQGARIEINNQYVGVAPLRVNIPMPNIGQVLFNVPTTSTNTVVIKANPVSPGQYTQTKLIFPGDQMPTHIFFNMNLEPVPQSQVNVNFNQ